MDNPITSKNVFTTQVEPVLRNLCVQLKEIGTRQVFFGCGGRNAFFLPVFQEYFDVSVEIDERSASFKALGFSKSSSDPVIVCTTSGSAVLETLPALAEAFYSRLPLVVISGDRPEHSEIYGLPQAMEQLHPLSPYVNQQISLSCSPLSKNQAHSLKLTLSEKNQMEGPLHINLRWGREMQSDPQIEPVFEFPIIDQHDSVLIVFGGGSEEIEVRCAEIVKSLIDDQDNLVPLPVWCAANVKDRSNFYSKFSYEIQTNWERWKTIIHIGDVPEASFWRRLEEMDVSKRPRVIHYRSPILKNILVNADDSSAIFRSGLGFGTWVSPNDANTRSFIQLFKDILSSALSVNHECGGTEILSLSILDLLSEHSESEVSLCFEALLSTRPERVFLGNSLAIRNWELYGDLLPFVPEVFVQRGLNGIDGQVSYAIGLALEKPEVSVVAILGDLTFLYDVGSLFQSKIPSNLQILVVDNQGGRIFEKIPNVPKEIIADPKLDLTGIVKNLPCSKQITVLRSSNSETGQLNSRLEKLILKKIGKQK